MACANTQYWCNQVMVVPCEGGERLELLDKLTQSVRREGRREKGDCDKDVNAWGMLGAKITYMQCRMRAR